MADEHTLVVSEEEKQEISEVLQEALRCGLLSEEGPYADFISEDAINSSVSNLKSSFPQDWFHSFAVKATPLAGVLNILKNAGLGAECASWPEVKHALNLGFEPSKIVFDSPCKTKLEIKAALEAGTMLNLDNECEIAKVEALLAAGGLGGGGGGGGEEENGDGAAAAAALASAGRVGLRVNPNAGEGSIAETSTATQTSKFGMLLTDANREDMVQMIRARPWIRGLHMHVGSQGVAVPMLAAAARTLVAFAEAVNGGGGDNNGGGGGGAGGGGEEEGGGGAEERAAAAAAAAAAARARAPEDGEPPPPAAPGAEGGRRPRQILWLDLGGGLSTSYADAAPAPYAEYCAALRAAAPQLFGGRYRVVTEFGRSLTTKAGWTASRVEAAKDCGGARTLVVHAGANQFLRPSYLPAKWFHRLSAYDGAGAPLGGALAPRTVAGPLCFSGDYLAKDRLLPAAAAAGDLLVVHDSASYSLAMWSAYNSRRAPAVLLYRRRRPPRGGGGEGAGEQKSGSVEEEEDGAAAAAGDGEEEEEEAGGAPEDTGPPPAKRPRGGAAAAGGGGGGEGTGGGGGGVELDVIREAWGVDRTLEFWGAAEGRRVGR